MLMYISGKHPFLVYRDGFYFLWEARQEIICIMLEALLGIRYSLHVRMFLLYGDHPCSAIIKTTVTNSGNGCTLSWFLIRSTSIVLSGMDGMTEVKFRFIFLIIPLT